MAAACLTTSLRPTTCAPLRATSVNCGRAATLRRSRSVAAYVSPRLTSTRSLPPTGYVHFGNYRACECRQGLITAPTVGPAEDGNRYRGSPGGEPSAAARRSTVDTAMHQLRK